MIVQLKQSQWRIQDFLQERAQMSNTVVFRQKYRLCVRIKRIQTRSRGCVLAAPHLDRQMNPTLSLIKPDSTMDALQELITIIERLL